MENTTEILAACDAIRTRFAGRAQLRREAERDSLALAELQHRLGMIDYGQFCAAELAELRAAATNGPVICGHAVRRLAEIRAARASARAGGCPLASRKPGHARDTIIHRRATEVIDAAGFREATHSHDTTIDVVAEGREGAASGTNSLRPSAVGLPNAYTKKGYWITASSHTWHVSAAILSPEVRALNAAAPAGVVYLSTSVRVRQGRGTSLTVEALTPRQALRALREAA